MRRTVCCVALLISSGIGLAVSDRDTAAIQLLAQQFVDAVNHKNVSE